MANRTLCQRALNRFEHDLSRRRNVVGLGIVPCRSGIRFLHKTEFAIAVYVSRKLPVADLPDDDVIPKVLQVMHKGNAIDVPVRVLELGPIALEHDSQ
jgi:hypothetical protein